jgi:hypothetical protein
MSFGDFRFGGNPPTTFLWKREHCRTSERGAQFAHLLDELIERRWFEGAKHLNTLCQ